MDTCQTHGQTAPDRNPRSRVPREDCCSGHPDGPDCWTDGDDWVTQYVGHCGDRRSAARERWAPAVLADVPPDLCVGALS